MRPRQSEVEAIRVIRTIDKSFVNDSGCSNFVTVVYVQARKHSLLSM